MLNPIPILIGLQSPPPVPACAPRRVVRTARSWALPDPDEDERPPTQRELRVERDAKRIEAYLRKSGPSRQITISDELDLSHVTVCRRLYELQHQKRVQCEKSGRNTLWSVPDA